MKIQSFSRYLSEDSAGYAKLQSKSYRKIRYNQEEQAITTGSTGAAIAGVAAYVEDNPELYDESYLKIFEELKTQSNPAIRSKDFEVFYSFSGSIRGSRRYGNANWSARFLYEFLSAGYNGGERFIDTYFNRVFMSRPVYMELEDMVQEVRSGIETKWSNGELRGGQWASFYRFQAAEMDHLKRSLASFSRGIRDDIITCLGNGLIPLNFSLAPSTIKKRLSLGLSGDTPFYATSWLINQIEVHVILGASESGSLFYSDSYKGA